MPILRKRRYLAAADKGKEILLAEMENVCPRCASHEKNKFGYSAGGYARFRCRKCLKTWQDKRITIDRADLSKAAKSDNH